MFIQASALKYGSGIEFRPWLCHVEEGRGITMSPLMVYRQFTNSVTVEILVHLVLLLSHRSFKFDHCNL